MSKFFWKGQHVSELSYMQLLQAKSVVKSEIETELNNRRSNGPRLEQLYIAKYHIEEQLKIEDKVGYEVCTHPTYGDLPYLLTYNAVTLARFDITGLQQRFGVDGAREFINTRVKELLGDKP